MKVLHVYKAYLPQDFTGIPRVIHSIAEGLTAHGVDSHVLAPSTSRDAPEFDVGSHHVHLVRQNLSVASTSVAVSAFGAFSKLAADADLVHYHFPWPFGDLIHMAVGRRKPSLVTYHSDIVKQQRLLRLYQPLMHSFLSRLDAIVATSPNYVETSSVLQRYRQRVHVIPLGIGERIAPAASDVEAWRARVGSGFFLFVGAARYYKGLPFLMDAAARSGLPVVIAGAFDPARSEFGAVPDNVTVLGEVSDPDKESLLELCGAMVLPSHLRSEAFGVALLEAARAGRPMICCELGTGTSYVNIDGETGIVVPPADAQALADAMMRIARDTDTAARMGAAARNRFERLFRSDAMCTQYLDLYDEVLQRHGAAKSR